MKKPQALIGLLAALGTAIGVLVAVVGLPYGRADYTAFADLYHGPTNTTGFFHMSVDCDTSTAAEDVLCFEPAGVAGSTDADVTIGNSTAGSALIAAYNWTLDDPDDSRLQATVPGSCTAPKLNCNPNFLDTGESTEGQSGTAWACDPVLADQDANTANGHQSIISCVNASDPPSLASGPAHMDMARVSYDIPGTAAVGVVTLSLKDVNVFDESVTELMSCNPIVTNEGKCFSADVEFIPPPPTSTPTDTPQATSTFTPTNTPTPIPDPGFQKVADSGNLWICVPDGDNSQPDGPDDGDCDGPGEGSVHVIEQAINVQSDYDNDGIADVNDPDIEGTGLANTELGLGAYEFSVEYDNFVIESVNPCDIVFGPTGEGVGRGPVDEVDASSPENADCTPDPNAVNNGTCAMSLILENIVHFGCVTAGSPSSVPPVPYGPASTFIGDTIDVASLELIPHEDLANDLFPGNNNGVLTVIKDNGCELADIFGHPTLGDVNGGLTPLCGDLAVTVRILEGDLNLDCVVDSTDAQTIAGHYGAFFGGLLYSKWLDLEPQFHDLDIDIKDIQKVFGRLDSTCEVPIPDQDPLPPPVGFGN